MKFAIIIAQIDGNYQKTLMQGMLKEAKRVGASLDVYTNFRVTDLYPNLGSRHFAGEKSIFFHIPYEKYDGIIVCLEMLRYKDDMRQWMQQEIREKFEGPVISLEYNSEHFVNVMHDDAEAMTMVVRHLFEEHGYTDYAFLSGPKEHPHAQMRLKGFVKGLEQCGLSLNEENVYEGDFWYDSGVETAEAMIRNGKLPQVLVCASESMAIGAYRVFLRNGIRVPEDVALTGFDALDEGLDEDMSITSMIRDGEDEGREAVCVLYSELTGEVMPVISKKPSPLLVRNSCGCSEREFTFSNQNSIAPLRPVNYGRYNNFYSNYNFMLENLLESKSFQYCVERLQAFLRFLGEFDQFAVCLYENWFEEADMKEKCCRETYVEYEADGQTMKACAPHRKIKRGEDFRMKQDEIVVSYYTPIYYQENAMGYSILRLSGASLPPECYQGYQKNINVALKAAADRRG